MEDKSHWDFIHNLAEGAEWTQGLREIFEYRDLGVSEGSKGDYVAHIIRHNGKEMADKVQKWHLHECDFQFVLVLNGTATFEYADEGVKTIKKGDAILQKPFIPHREISCSEDFEVLEIVSPADFKTREVEGPDEASQVSAATG